MWKIWNEIASLGLALVGLILIRLGYDWGGFLIGLGVVLYFYFGAQRLNQ